MQWEYCQYVNGMGCLNDLGKDGWELVTVIRNPYGLFNTELVYFFKRPIKPSEEAEE